MLDMIAIIGAGPAGLMAAEYLAQRGHFVTVYDRMPSVARKLLMAGRGGLNITHSEDLAQFLGRYGVTDPRLLEAIRAFPPVALRAWCHDLGQETFVGSSGRVFPKAMKASPLLRAWLRRLADLGVVIETGWTWRGWDDGGVLMFETRAGIERVTASATVLALGGGSWPNLGSNGAWVDMLAARGIEIAPLHPANSGFTVAWSDLFRDRYAGQPLKNIAVHIDGITARGEAMITAAGIEGGVIYALGRAIRTALEAANGPVTIWVDLRPDLSEAVIAKKLAQPRHGQSLGNHIRRCLSLSPAARHLIYEGGAVPDDPMMLASRIKATPISIMAPCGIARAISSAGGVRACAIDDAGMLKNLPGVFVTGEMLDWEAPTGGYLLQACFAHARMVGAGVDGWLRHASFISSSIVS